MKPLFLSLLFLFSYFLSNGQIASDQISGKMEMRSPYFSFGNMDVPSSGSLNNITPNGTFVAKGKPETGFAVVFTVDFRKFQDTQNILSIPGVLTVSLRMSDPNKLGVQNYQPFKMKDGSLPVLEARIFLHDSTGANPFKNEKIKKMRIGFPIAILDHPLGKHKVVLNFTGVNWVIYVDNEKWDNNFPIGYPHWSGRNEWLINPKYVKNAEIFFPCFKARREKSKNNEVKPDVLFWSPRGHNTCVGDVVTIFYKGRYHVFYLYDRRHGDTKLGVAGDYFEHFSTANFKTWTEHEAAAPLEAQWETIGTGTPFVYNNKLYLSYGMHTERIYPDSLTAYSKMIDYYKKNGKTDILHFNVKKAYPAGATYAVSQDGIHFKQSHILFHFCDNPSVFTTSSGKLMMYANYRSKGTWQSAAPDSGWHCINENFPPGGDCTFHFLWGNYDYIVGGFVGLWKRPADSANGPWEDMVAKGQDFYNGLNVPSVTGINNGRYLMAGWIPMNGWGGVFAISELIQYPDGRIGSKWMKELTPARTDTTLLAKRIEKESFFPVKNSSFILSFDVYPKQMNSDILAVSFLTSENDKYNNGCEFRLNLGKVTAQYSNASKDPFAAPEEKTLREGGAPQHDINYAIGNLIGTNKPFKVRILVENRLKWGGSILYTEIAGQNTMISYREGLTIKNIAFDFNKVDIRNIKLMEIEK